MSDHVQELWEEPTIPERVEAFWETLREAAYPELPAEDGGLCAVYDRHDEEPDGKAEIAYIGRFDGENDAIQTEVRATYVPAHPDIATADTVEMEYGLDEMMDNGYSITALDPDDVLPLQEAIVEAEDEY